MSGEPTKESFQQLLARFDELATKSEAQIAKLENENDQLMRLNKSMQVYFNLMQGEIRVIKERLDQHDKEILAQPNK